jgi:hypothetical protein
MKLLLMLNAAVFLAACAGSHSTLKNGFAYRMPRESARDVVRGSLAANVPNDRISCASDLEASGSVRHLADKHTFFVSAVPLPSRQAFGFEVRHTGTLFSGPSIAQHIYDAALLRANAAGQRIPTR